MMICEKPDTHESYYDSVKSRYRRWDYVVEHNFHFIFTFFFQSCADNIILFVSEIALIFTNLKPKARTKFNSKFFHLFICTFSKKAEKSFSRLKSEKNLVVTFFHIYYLHFGQLQTLILEQTREY